MISVVFVSNSVWVSFRIGISIVMVQLGGGGCLTVVYFSQLEVSSVRYPCRCVLARCQMAEGQLIVLTLWVRVSVMINVNACCVLVLFVRAV